MNTFNSKETAISLFLGILLHGILLAIAISLACLKVWNPPVNISFVRAGICLVLLTLFRPIGILLGLGIGSMSGYGAHLTTAILQSLSAGIFIHVTFFSLLTQEFGKTSSGCHSFGQDNKEVKIHWKLVCLVLGWLSLAFIILAVHHSHWIECY